jgi:hypothetical protein
VVASFLTAGLPVSRLRGAPAWCLLAALGFATSAGPVFGGAVFREVERVESGGVPGSWQQRQVFAGGENCKILIEQSSDPLEPAGSYFLTLSEGSFFIDPARATLAPVVPADMQPAERIEGEPNAQQPPMSVAVAHEIHEPGPRMFDLPTTHHVYRLRIEESAGTVNPAPIVEERHELWAAAAPDAQFGLQAWRERRINEDGGTEPARAAVRDALALIYGQGLALRHIIERRELTAAAVAPDTPPERVVRAITQVSRQEIPADAFRKPTGLADTEFLAPTRE